MLICVIVPRKIRRKFLAGFLTGLYDQSHRCARVRVGRSGVQAQLGRGKPCRSRKELNMSRVNRLQCTDRKRQGDYEWFGPKELTIIRNGQVIVMDR